MLLQNQGAKEYCYSRMKTGPVQRSLHDSKVCRNEKFSNPDKQGSKCKLKKLGKTQPGTQEHALEQLFNSKFPVLRLHPFSTYGTAQQYGGTLSTVNRALVL